ncbi:hypothetical protein ACVXHA_12070 [Escherichia coli]
MNAWLDSPEIRQSASLRAKMRSGWKETLIHLGLSTLPGSGY